VPTAEPTAAPTSAPTAEPTAEPTAAPTAQPTAVAEPTRPPSANALPNDVPWFRLGKDIHGDDEMIDFDKYGLPRPAYAVHAAPDGAYIAYLTEEGKLTVIDTQRYDSYIRPDESIGDIVGFAFSPDSRSLALTTIGADNTWALQVRDIASGATKKVAEGVLYASTPSDPLPLVVRPIAWTPTGLVAEHVLWASDAPPRNVALVNVDDGSIRILREKDHVNVFPAHDGMKVAIVTGYMGMGEPPQNGLAILDVASGQEHVLVADAQRLIRQVRWSPDDAMLLYADADDYQSSTTMIHAMNADGSNEQIIAVGSQAVQVIYADVAWLDHQTVLLLSADLDDFRLDRVPVAGFEPSNIQTIASGPRGQADPSAMQIIYTP
jgi:dipeptidyl aminopeptidase/acylaminoacyl peptidase